MNVYLSSEDWCELTGITVLDPDGWNREADHFNSSWTSPITFDEFYNRMGQSTCTGPGHRVDYADMRRDALTRLQTRLVEQIYQ